VCTTQEVKKRLPRRGDKDLLVWQPLIDEFQLADPLTSTYGATFRHGSELSCCDRDVNRQKYVPTLELVYRNHPHETTYRYDIGQYNPHRPFKQPLVRSYVTPTLPQRWVACRQSAVRPVIADPCSITERRVSELIPVLGSQPAGDVCHKPGGRLPLLSVRPAITPATLNRAATSFAAW